MTFQEKANSYLAKELETLENWRKGYFKYCLILTNMLEIFDSTDNISFDLRSYEVNIYISKVNDINETLKFIHQKKMRPHGWYPKPFEKDNLTWNWTKGNFFCTIYSLSY